MEKTYKQVAEKINDFLKNQGFVANDKIPNETKLCTLLGYSRNIIREAMYYLEFKGIIRIEQGRGSFLNEPDSMDKIIEDAEKEGWLLSVYGNEKRVRFSREIYGGYHPYIKIKFVCNNEYFITSGLAGGDYPMTNKDLQLINRILRLWGVEI